MSTGWASRGPAGAGAAPGCPVMPIEGILFDRDGTLIVDVPLNVEPDRVRLMPTAAAAVAEARRMGLRVGVATNQPGLSDGRLEPLGFWRVNARTEQLAGPFDLWEVCPHPAAAGCACRKPQPGMLLSAARHWGIAPARLALVGDTGADVGAAVAAGARAVLVPNARTRAEETAAAPLVGSTLLEAVRLLASPAAGGPSAAVTVEGAAAR